MQQIRRLQSKNSLNAVLFLLISCFVALSQAATPQEVAITSLDGTVLKAWVFVPIVVPVENSKSEEQKQRGTVIAFHGCGGLYANAGARKGSLNARHQAMADLLVQEGYNVVFTDSFTPRGETSICSQPIGTRKITQRERRQDALGALSWVVKQPWADKDRVAILGWSNGGSTVLAAIDAIDASHSLVKNKQSLEKLTFKTAIAFYPGCADTNKNRYNPNTTLTLFLGADDDWTPPIPCMELAKHLQSENYKVELNVYEGAVHDFDNPVGYVKENKNIPSHLHVGKGVISGPNPAAREKAYTRLKVILKDALAAP